MNRPWGLYRFAIQIKVSKLLRGYLCPVGSFRELTFSRFSSAKGILKSRPITSSWEDWISVLSSHDTISKKDTTNYVFGKIKSGQTRNDKNVEWIDAMALDIDGVSDEVLEGVVEILGPFEFVLYTSFNHKAPDLDPDHNNKVRIILPLNDRVAPQDYKRIQSQFDTLIGGENDKAVRKVSQPYYTHSSPADRKVDAFAMYNAGSWISVSDLPDVTVYESATAQEFASSMHISKNDLRKEGRKLQRSTNSAKRKMGFYLERVADDEAFVTDTTRDNVMFLMACHVVETWPAVDAKHASELFRGSLEALYQIRQFEIGVGGAILEMQNKMRRRQERLVEERAEKAQKRNTNRERINRNIRADGMPHDYNENELSEMAEMQSATRSDIEKMAIVYCGSANFFMTQMAMRGLLVKMMLARLLEST